MPVNNKQGFVRKHFFIDRKMQGRYMMTLLIPMLIMLVFFLIVLYSASQSIVATTTRIIKEEVENKIAVQFQDQQNPSVEAYQALLNNIKSYVRDFSNDAKYRKAVLESLMWIFGIGILIIVIQIALLTIFFSHKLAGPVYRFEKMCHTLIEGNYTDKIYLRRGDEMQNLANLINEMIRMTDERLAALRDAKSEDEKNRIVSSLKI
jgi:nitrogen fixation/metabolism regulation signal transduction histidine kinase